MENWEAEKEKILLSMPTSGELGIKKDLFDELMEKIDTARVVYCWAAETDLYGSAREYLGELAKIRRETAKHMDALTKISNDDQAILVLGKPLIDLFSKQFPVISKIILERIERKPDGRRTNFSRKEFFLQVDRLFTEATGGTITFNNVDPYGVSFQFLNASRSGLPDLEDLKRPALAIAFRRAVTTETRKEFLEDRTTPLLKSLWPPDIFGG